MAKYKYKYKRSKKGKPANYVSKEWAKSKKGAKSQSSQILALQRQMNAVKMKVGGNIQWSQYQYKPPVFVHSGGVLTGPTPFVFPMVSPSAHSEFSRAHPGWRRIFNSDAQIQNNIKWQGRSVGIEYQASLGNPATTEAPITCTLFIVSLRPKVAQLLAKSTEFLKASDLVDGEHYVQNNMGSVQGQGMVFLNKSMFKIHHVDRFMVGSKTNFVTSPPGTINPTTNLKDNLHRRYITLPYKHELKGDGSGTTDNTWSALNWTTVPHKAQLYCMVFPNNYGDQTFDLAFNALFTGRTTQ